MKRKNTWKIWLRLSLKAVVVLSVLSFLVFFVFCLPDDLFEKPCSTAMFDRDGALLSAHIAKDGQWRFPHNDSVPEKFRVAIIQFEDRHFENHLGVYLPSIFRAMKQNLSAGRTVSGGSTLSMQVIRMSRDNPSRTITEKFLEMIRALRIESRYSKDEILAMYTSNAPMGGNVVGLDAAAWRYYGRNAKELSWAETVTLAVLPNAPSLIYPGKNQEKLTQKRNRLLEHLFTTGYIDETTLEISKLEPLPQKPNPLPQMASHLMNASIKDGNYQKRVATTIDKQLQKELGMILQRHNRELLKNEIRNAAALIIDVKNKEVLAYVGNTSDVENRYANQVDVIQAPRSTGSILKPFLYCSMLDEGDILPRSLVADVPSWFGAYSPKNFHEEYDGAISADRALSRSLNVPAVFMLRKYGMEKFHHRLQTLNFRHINKPSSHYGLSLVLGGCEASLWDIANAYAGMSYTLGKFYESNGQYSSQSYASIDYLKNQKQTEEDISEYGFLSASSIYNTYEALLRVNRPSNETGWGNYSSSHKVAWKTGTSFGFRDAWAVGTTPNYVVAVWVGNADGEGRPGIVGVQAAAPIMFDVFDLLPSDKWFDVPWDDMLELEVCSNSGYRAGMYCDEKVNEWVPASGVNCEACPYHQTIHLNKEGERVNSSCEEIGNIENKNWFVLPTTMEWYYKKKHPEYIPLPPFAEACMSDVESKTMDLIYPKHNAKIYIPKDLDGQRSKLICKATHRKNDALLYWHLDNQFLGESKYLHHMEIQVSAGKYTLTIVDEKGQTIIRNIEILDN